MPERSVVERIQELELQVKTLSGDVRNLLECLDVQERTNWERYAEAKEATGKALEELQRSNNYAKQAEVMGLGMKEELIFRAMIGIVVAWGHPATNIRKPDAEDIYDTAGTLVDVFMKNIKNEGDFG